MSYANAIGLLVIFGLFVVCTVSAVNGTELGEKSDSIWNGTWSTPDYTMYIIQNQSGIGGEYVPRDLDLLDPGWFEGNLSEDGRTFTGVWIETGSNTYTLSDDKMSFTINGSADIHGPMTEPAYYNSNATRIGEIMDSANPWSGNWASQKKSYNLTQNGKFLSGINMPLTNVNDENGTLSGVVSDDGTIYTGNWTEIGGLTLVMSENGTSFDATITKSLDPKAFVENVVFSK
ncbi:hypothetical protein [uncultured Methanospirillum sp.]|uniref:hypothetical protein n=1 Tax=uncultured Methanospirillum sp. TaxID=262503 RepID=UPI0029C70600|nr:hypothetical protein [uncultured Methanospirillum sp.]